MAQSNALLRFRARLRSRGYKDISIKRFYDHNGEIIYDDAGWPIWYVSCIEPLLGYMVIFCASEAEMDQWPDVPFTNSDYNSIQVRFNEGGEGLFV